MSDQSYKELDPKLIQSGIVKSLNPLVVPLWLDGSNVIFEDGMVRKARGFYSSFTKPSSEPPRGIKALQDGGIQRLFWGTHEKLYDWSTGTVNTSSATFSGQKDETVTARATAWSMETWGSWGVAANGIADDNFYINKFTGNGWEKITGKDVPTKVEKLVRRGPMLLAFNTDEGGQMFEWCNLDNIEDWDRSVDGTAAGNLFVRDLDSEIIDAARFGEVVLAYSSNQVVQINFLGNPFYFGYNPILEGIGAVSKQSVVMAMRRHFGLSKTGFWETDGASFRYIDPPFLRIWLQKNINKNQLSKVCGWWNNDRRMICWSIPTTAGSENDITLGYNYENQTWTFFPYGRTAGMDNSIYGYPVCAEPFGSIFFHEFGVNFDGQAATSYVQTRPLDLRDASVWKYIDSLKVMLHELAGTVTVTLGTQEFIDDAISWSDPLTLDDGYENLYDRIECKFLTLKFSSDLANDDWAISGFELFGDIPRGRED